MANFLRKSVCLGFEGTGVQDFRNVAGDYTGTGTRWVRIWADLARLWPTHSGGVGQMAEAEFQNLTYQMQAANQAGIGVILTAENYPRWINGTEFVPPDFMRDDRLLQSGELKPLTWRPPLDVSMNGPWAVMMWTLMSGYNRFNPNTYSWKPVYAYADIIEVCNEPNLKWWPQVDSFGVSNVHCIVTQMFQTAKAIQDTTSFQPVLGGPASDDQFLTAGENRKRTSYDLFTENLLVLLDAFAFLPTKNFVWTHHHYVDMVYDQGASPPTTAPDVATKPAEVRAVNRAHEVWKKLVDHAWGGWPNGLPGSNVSMMLTEAGASLDKIKAVYGISGNSLLEAKQKDLLNKSWNRMRTSVEGSGIAMFTNYLMYSEEPWKPGRFDCGLRYAQSEGGAARQAYSTWSGYPGFF